jgi:hypothetical protein
MVEKRPRADAGEVLVPFSHERGQVPEATHIRSTMIASSVATLRARGLLDAYRSHLDPAYRDELPGTVAGFWLPIEHGVAHYEACDRLRLTAAELLSIGESVSERVTKSALSFAVKLAAGGGVSPWTILPHSRRLWERIFQGSSLAVYKLGPKEARIELVAWQLARIEYNRISFRGILRSMTLPFCAQSYVHEVSALCTPTSLAYRIAWA